MKTSLPKLAAVLVVLMVGASQPVSSAVAKTPDTTRSMMALSAKAADEKFKGDLLSVLQPTGKFNPAHVIGVPLYTIPHGAGFKGLCGREELFLTYIPTGTREDFRDVPLRVGTVNAQLQFHVAKGLVVDLEHVPGEAALEDGDCRKLQSDRAAPWFTAQTREDAAKAVNVFRATMAAMRSGALKATECHLNRSAKTCEEQLLLRDQLSGIAKVEKVCATSAAASAPYVECFKISLGESGDIVGPLGDVIELTIVAIFNSETPAEIQSVSASESLIVS